MQPQLDALVADLATVAEATNAARTLSTAVKSLEAFKIALASLKKDLPEKTANAKLKNEPYGVIASRTSVLLIAKRQHRYGGS